MQKHNFLSICLYLDDSDYYDGSGSGEGSNHEMDYESKTPVPTVTATSMAKESDNSIFYTKMNSEVKNDSTTSANNTKNIDPKYDEIGKNVIEKSLNNATIQTNRDQKLKETFLTSSKDVNTNSEQNNCKNDILEETIKERDILKKQLTVMLIENDLLKRQLKQRNENYDVLHEKVNGLKKYFLSMFP